MKKLPEFSVINHLGETITQNYFDSGSFILYFYPKDDTPGCTKESCDFRDSFELLKQKGIQILGISKDKQIKHQKFKEKYLLPFVLLTDETGDVCKKFGAWGEKSFMGKKFEGIIRSTFFIVDGCIHKEWINVRAQSHVKDVLEYLS